jgi:phage terminase large subunit-like protein
MDNEPGAEVYTAATKRDQARIVHEESIRMVRASPGLRKHVREFRDNLNMPSTNSKFEPLGADSDTIDGLNISGCIIDELHAHKTRKLWDKVVTGTQGRRQPLIVIVTTAGYDKHSICHELYSHARKVLEGIIPDDSFFAYIAELDNADDWKNEKVWIKANPNLGISPKREGVADECQRAKDILAYQNTFRRFHMNQWTEQSTRAISLDHWKKCAGLIREDTEQGNACYLGLDLANITDLAAMAAVFPVWQDDEFIYRVEMKFWLPTENLRARVEHDRVPYDLWAQQGWITLTEGNVIDYARIRQDINLYADRGHEVRQIACDEWNAVQLASQLQEDGFNVGTQRIGMRSIGDPTKQFLVLIRSHKIDHGNNPVLTWMASNVVTVTDAQESIRPDKEKSIERIDGIIAVILGLGRALLKEGEARSVYEERGLIFI